MGVWIHLAMLSTLGHPTLEQVQPIQPAQLLAADNNKSAGGSLRDIGKIYHRPLGTESWNASKLQRKGGNIGHILSLFLYQSYDMLNKFDRSNLVSKYRPAFWLPTLRERRGE